MPETGTERAAPNEARLSNGLNVAEWPGEGPPILALHGSTSTHHTWSKLAADFPARRVIAPDLRGRGGSMAMGGPYGLTTHARDVQALIEARDLRDVVLVGHSMGGFISPLVAKLANGRVTRMVLLDGGPPVALPFFFVKPVVRMVFQRQARAVARPFESVDALVDGPWGSMLKNHPHELKVIAGWLAASAIGPDGRKTMAVVPESLPEDGVSSFFDPEIRRSSRELACPAHFLYASWGAKDGARPLYTPRWAAALQKSIPDLICTHVEGANHLTLLFRPEVAQAIAGR